MIDYVPGEYTIAVAGMGYVGLNSAVLLAQNNKVYAVDIVPEKVEMLKKRQSPVRDQYIEQYLAEKDLHLVPTIHAKIAYRSADYVIIATPSIYDLTTRQYDTSAVEEVVRMVHECNPNAVMIIRSSVPDGYIHSMLVKYRCDNILFCPMFRSMCRKLYPRRLVIGRDPHDLCSVNAAEIFAAMMRESAPNEKIEIYFMDYDEAEKAQFGELSVDWYEV